MAFTITNAISYEAPLDPSTVVGFMPISQREHESLKMFAPITIAYHFHTVLDPNLLCKSLSTMMAQYPQYTGRAVNREGKMQLQIGAHPPAVLVLEVPAPVVQQKAQWLAVLAHHPLRPPEAKGSKLFQALLLRTRRPADGCTLMVSIDHGFADATTCAIFMAAWSQLHVQHFGSVPGLAPMRLPPDVDLPCSTPGLAVRRFFLHPRQLSTIKETINEDAKTGLKVTSNDILIAIVACACLPKTPPTTGRAMIIMMVDKRGRGLSPKYMGNAAHAINVFVDWAALWSADLAVVATAVRRGVVEGLADLTSRAGTPAPRPQEPFLEWNSWARASGLLAASFGAPLAAFDWVNLQMIDDPRCAVIIPVTSDGGLALQIALLYPEMAYLRQLWSTFLTPMAAA